MTGAALPFLPVLLLGIGATLTFDLWALLLRQAVGVAPSNFCLVGRWLRYMPEGIFTHRNIVSAPQKSGECAVGWIAHYMIGILFAMAFLRFAGTGWLQHPTPIPALVFGVVTVAAPFLIMQPAFGLGLAASRTSKPTQVRLRSLMNHAVFGIGLYLSGTLVSWLL